MIYRHMHRHGVWVDLEQPTEEEIHDIALEFGIGERIEAELLSPTPAPLVAAEEELALSVLHFPVSSDESGVVGSQEVDIVVGQTFLVTVRYEVVASLDGLRKVLEAEELVSGRAQLGTDALLEVLFAHLYDAVREESRVLETRLSTIERHMFSGQERSSVRAISDVNRSYLHLESTLRGQEEPLERFLRALSARGFFGPSFRERADRILGEQTQVLRLIQMQRAMAAELRETNQSLLESRQNEVMKTLTVVNFIFLPLELIAFVFGMHALGTPLEQNSHAFWIIMGVMLAFVAFMTAYFAKKRWLF